MYFFDTGLVQGDDGNTLTHFIECKRSDAKPHRALVRFADQWQNAQAVQVVRNLRAEQDHRRVLVRGSAQWLNGFDA